jgi:hypothetical protein
VARGQRVVDDKRGVTLLVLDGQLTRERLPTHPFRQTLVAALKDLADLDQTASLAACQPLSTLRQDLPTAGRDAVSLIEICHLDDLLALLTTRDVHQGDGRLRRTELTDAGGMQILDSHRDILRIGIRHRGDLLALERSKLHLRLNRPDDCFRQSRLIHDVVNDCHVVLHPLSRRTCRWEALP